jgi:hypothetical protein
MGWNNKADFSTLEKKKIPGGASIMIKEGVLENPKPQGIVALHVNPALKNR